MSKSKRVTYSFTARLEEAMYGNFTYAAAFLPKKITEVIPAGRQRTKGTINDVPFSLAIQYRKDGRSFFLLSRALCEKAGGSIGSSAEVSFRLVDPDILDLPEELEAVLAQDDDARKVWDAFTRGRQRSLTIYVTSVKGVDSRIKRSIDLANKMKAGQLHVQMNQRKKQS